MAEKKTPSAEKVAAPERKERKNLVVNDKVLEAHRANHTFRSAAPGKSHDSPITGASSRWLKNDGDTIIYDPVFRTVGTEEQIREELSRSGVSGAEIEDALAKSYTWASVTQDGEIRDQYIAELEGARKAAFVPRDFGLDWEKVAPIFQAKKSEITRKGKAAKGKKRSEGKTHPRKKKTAAEVRKDLIEKNSDFSVLFTAGGWSRIKDTSIGRNYYFSKEQHVALQTPEDLATALAQGDFGTFDLEADFNRWYRERDTRKTAERPTTTTTTTTSASAAPRAAASGKQSPVRIAPGTRTAKPAPPRVQDTVPLPATTTTTTTTTASLPPRRPAVSRR